MMFVSKRRKPASPSGHIAEVATYASSYLFFSCVTCCSTPAQECRNTLSSCRGVRVGGLRTCQCEVLLALGASDDICGRARIKFSLFFSCWVEGKCMNLVRKGRLHTCRRPEIDNEAREDDGECDEVEEVGRKILLTIVSHPEKRYNKDSRIGINRTANHRSHSKAERGCSTLMTTCGIASARPCKG